MNFKKTSMRAFSLILITILVACGQTSPEDTKSIDDESQAGYEETEITNEKESGSYEDYTSQGINSADESSNQDGVSFEELRQAIGNQNTTKTSDPDEYLKKFNVCINMYDEAFKSLPDFHSEELNFVQLNVNFDQFQEAVECYTNDAPNYTTMDELFDLIMTYVEMQNKAVDYINYVRMIENKIAAGEDYRILLDKFYTTVLQMQEKRENFVNHYKSFTK
ncbi:hypothetical protein [Neobacillus citreus]|uniref:Lipoprotein n=1 Tax=Neobacillus citreus TaxID=2833578 RepID=A0A942T2Z2_9BACI|nr:hypothetical protein [Neobacillus citreus]MCH6266591.1 hypothetical protein [Neobacillus citreus]